MTYDYHIVLGVVVVLMSAAGYGSYFWSIFRGLTKPHPFTWLIFAVIDGTIFFAQTVSGGGPGAWVFGIAATMNAIIFLLSLTKGEKRVTQIDWACLFFAIIGIILWWTTNNPLTAILCGVVADTLAKVPTLRKSYVRPFEESMILWGLDVFKYSFAILALTSFTLITVLPQAEVAITNAIVVGVVLLRRRQLAKMDRQDTMASNG